MFTLGSVDSTKASGAEQTTERQITQIKHNIVKNTNRPEVNQLAITSVAEDLNSGLPWNKSR